MRVGTRDRDAGLRRVSSVSRWFVAGAVALAGAFSGAVAQAVPGFSGAGTGTRPAAPRLAAPTLGAPASGSRATPTPAATDRGLVPGPAPVATTRHPAAVSGAS